MRNPLNPRAVYLFFLGLFLLMLICLPRKSVPSPTTISSESKPKQEKTISRVDKTLATMTVEEKVGQLFFSRVPATEQIEDLKTFHLGGYLLFSRDMSGQTLESLSSTIASYQAASNIPLLIGSDEEGGTVTRISQLLETPFASPQELFASGGLSEVVSDTHAKAKLLRSVGIHTGLFPLADMAMDSESFIYDRTLGQDLKTTTTYVSEVVKALKAEQFGSTLKHFPGYGDNEDSHTDIIYDDRSLEELRTTDFKPFAAGISAGADSILVAHNIVSAIDEVPSSLSPKINQILRKELGFQGVIMTDDMDMAGLADFVAQDEAAFRVLQAGNDMIISSEYAVQIPYLLAKIDSGELTIDRLDQSVRRILEWKDKLGLLE